MGRAWSISILMRLSRRSRWRDCVRSDYNTCGKSACAISRGVWVMLQIMRVCCRGEEKVRRRVWWHLLCQGGRKKIVQEVPHSPYVVLSLCNKCRHCQMWSSRRFCLCALRRFLLLIDNHCWSSQGRIL